MPRMARFILALIVGLALLMWAASGVVQTTAREWFERDVSSRAQLVLTGARQSLADSWYDPVSFRNSWSPWRATNALWLWRPAATT